MRIGLFGGTFDPPHAAHLHVTAVALRRLQLHRVWWLVTPGNPLKAHGGLTPLPERVAQARALLRDRRVIVSDLESRIGTRYTADTLAWLRRHCPGVRFVWIMGADILAQLHRWERWEEIAATIPLAVVDRPGASLAATAAPAAHALARWRLPERDAPLLAATPAPAFTILHGRRLHLSSTLLRKSREAASLNPPSTPSGGKAAGSD